MKKQILILLAAFMAVNSIFGQTLRVDQERVKREAIKFSKDEANRKKTLVVATTLGLVGFGGLWLLGSSSDTVSKIDFDTLKAKVEGKQDKDPKKDIAQAEATQANNAATSFFGKINNKCFGFPGYTFNFVKSAVSKTPGIAKDLFQAVLWAEAIRNIQILVGYKLPSMQNFAERYLSSRTVAWTIKHNTSLEESLTNMLDMVKSYKESDSVVFKNSVNNFVMQTEKIFGCILYHIYKLSKLDVEDAEEKALAVSDAKEILASLKVMVNDISSECQNLINTNKMDLVNFEDLLIKFINRLYNFRVTERYLRLSYDNTQEVFDNLVFIINPTKSKFILSQGNLAKVVEKITDQKIGEIFLQMQQQD